MVVRYCLIVIFILCYQDLVAQDLQGTYFGDDGITYQFINDSTFKTVTLLHFADKEIAKGSYKIVENTLFLNFKPIKSQSKASFKFIEKKNNIIYGDTLSQDSTIFVHFKIVDANNKPIVPPPILQIRNEKKQTIQSFTADTLGNIPEIFILGSFKGYFYFTSLANKEFKIGADTLLGYKSSVKVILPDRITYKDSTYTKKYLIKEKTNNRIILQPPKTNKKLVLKREESD